MASKAGGGGSSTARKMPAAALAGAGVPVDKGELRQAFDFFDLDHKGYLTADDLKARLPIFYKNMPARELKFLMNNKTELSFADLYDLLNGNSLANFDPAVEAFKVYDPKGTGFVSSDVLKDVFAKLDFGEITDDDVKILIETADADGDGKVGLADFRAMLQQKLDLGELKPE